MTKPFLKLLPPNSPGCGCCGEPFVTDRQCNCHDNEGCQRCGYCVEHCRCGIDATTGRHFRTAPHKVPSLGPDAPIETNDAGGQQSKTPYSLMASFPHRAILDVAAVVKRGLERYAPDNWKLIPRTDHLNHALAHIHAYGCGDDQEGDPIEHLRHAACRLLMALETQ